METKIAVRLMFSNAEGVPRAPAQFWDLLQSTGGQDPVRLFAVINNALIVLGPMNADLHTELEAEFADAGLRDTLATHRSKSEADIVLFNRPANLLALKLLLGIDRHVEEAADALTRVGAIALHANDYVQSPEEMWEGDPDLIVVLAEFAPIWELNNPRDIFKLFVRTFLIVTEDLVAHENMTKLLATSFGAGPQRSPHRWTSDGGAPRTGLWHVHECSGCSAEAEDLHHRHGAVLQRHDAAARRHRRVSRSAKRRRRDVSR